MNLSQFLPSVHFAISQLKDGSEDAQMHSFYLSKLAAALQSTPENRSSIHESQFVECNRKIWFKRLFIENGRFGAKAMSPEEFKREFLNTWEIPEPPTVVVYGIVDIKIAYAVAKHYGCQGVNFMASMIVKGVVNTVPERPQYEIEGVTIMSAKHCIEELGL